MLQESTLNFAKTLANNNSKAWVDAHRDTLNAARDDLMALGNELVDRADKYDPEIAQAGLEARHLTRYNRDPRFLYGKPPFRTDLDLSSTPAPGLNASTTTSTSSRAIVMPVRLCSSRARQRWHACATLIATRTDAWNRIISTKPFVAAFPDGIEAYGELKTAPRGYSVDHPAIAFLRMKGLGTRAKLTEREVCADDLVDRLMSLFRAVKPMVTFLNTGA